MRKRQKLQLMDYNAGNGKMKFYKTIYSVFLVPAAFVIPMNVACATASQTILTESDGQKLIHAGEDAAHNLKANICIAVLDQSGLLLSFSRMDNAPIGCINSAIEKGRAAVLYRTPTKSYMDRANGKEPAIATLPGMVPLGGGTPIVVNGQVVGAVGVSGSKNENEVNISKISAESIK